MYEVVTRLLEKMHWMSLNQVALATDGVSSMTGHRTWLVTRMCVEVPTLINVHCITHCDALVATRVSLEFKCWIILPTKFEWMGYQLKQCAQIIVEGCIWRRLYKGFTNSCSTVIEVISWPAYYNVCWYYWNYS